MLNFRSHRQPDTVIIKHRPLNLVTVVGCTRPPTYNDSCAHFIKSIRCKCGPFLFIYSISCFVHSCVSFVQVARLLYLTSLRFVVHTIALLIWYWHRRVDLQGRIPCFCGSWDGAPTNFSSERLDEWEDGGVFTCYGYICITCPYTEYFLTYSFLLLLLQGPALSSGSPPPRTTHSATDAQPCILFAYNASVGFRIGIAEIARALRVACCHSRTLSVKISEMMI